MWYQLNIYNLANEALEPLSELLEELGAVSISYTDNQDTPIYEPELNTTPLWQNTVLTALFNDQNLRQAAAGLLEQDFPGAKYDLEDIEDRLWEREWLKSFQPILFGKRLWVCPTHCEVPEPSAVNVMLDPGLAFGTGTHPTTALCLKFLDGLNLKEQIIADYGTGSGILAIAALKLGAIHAYAVDIDPQAVIATQQNAITNQLKLDKDLTVGLVDDIKLPQVDVLLANILAGPLMELAPKLVSLTKPGGTLILSGLLTEQLDEVCAKYRPLVQDIEHQHQDEWALVHMTVK